MSTISLFKNIENKQDGYRGRDCMKKSCKSLTARNEDNLFQKEKNEVINK